LPFFLKSSYHWYEDFYL